MKVTSSIDGADKSAPPTRALARRLIDLIKAGESVPGACTKLGIDPLIVRQNSDLRKMMQLLLAEMADIPSEVARELVRAVRLRTLVEFADSPDMDERKVSLAAAKQIAGDPDVGLNAPAAPLVQINVQLLRKLFSTLDEEPEVIEAEVVKRGD